MLSGSGTSATGATPKGVSVQDGETVFLATINDIQIIQQGKKLVQEKMKSTPSAIAANPKVKGEFAVGSEVPSSPRFFPVVWLVDSARTPKSTFIHIRMIQSNSD